MRAERTARELEGVSERETDRERARERETQKSRQEGHVDWSLETGGRWKAEGLPFSWR